MSLPRIFGAALLALHLAPPASGQGVETAPRRMLAAHEQLEWRGIGRLNIRGGGYCTASLVSETLAVTAAHCLFDGLRRRNDVELWFAAGYRDGEWEAIRQARRTAVLKEYKPTADGRGKVSRVGADIALVELDAPVLGSVIPHYPAASLPGEGGAVALLSYGRGRSNALSLQEPCRVLERRGDVASLDCEVAPGSSGAAVFRRGPGGAPEMTAIISGHGGGRTFAAVLEEALPVLRAALAETGPRRKTVSVAAPAQASGGAAGLRTGGSVRFAAPGGAAASSAPRLGGGSAWQGRRPPQ